MRYTILFGILAILALASCAQPPSDVPRAQISTTPAETLSATQNKPADMTLSSFEFEGYGPGKSHIGTFEEWEGTLLYEGETIKGFTGTINAGSVNTTIERLDAHLKTEDFFDVALYPEIVFETMSINEGTASGKLTFHGVTHDISFPVTVSDAGVTSEFLLDTTPFNIKYTGINKDVRIKFMLAP